MLPCLSMPRACKCCQGCFVDKTLQLQLAQRPPRSHSRGLQRSARPAARDLNHPTESPNSSLWLVEQLKRQLHITSHSNPPVDDDAQAGERYDMVPVPLEAPLGHHLLLDTLAENAEDGGGDGMAIGSYFPPTSSQHLHKHTPLDHTSGSTAMSNALTTFSDAFRALTRGAQQAAAPAPKAPAGLRRAGLHGHSGHARASSPSSLSSPSSSRASSVSSAPATTKPGSSGGRSGGRGSVSACALPRAAAHLAQPSSTWRVWDVPAADGHPPGRFFFLQASPETEAAVAAAAALGEDADVVPFGPVTGNAGSMACLPRAGADEAAALYTMLLPAIMDFVAETRGGRVAFTGEGVGGGLAVVVGLMAAGRGLRSHLMLPLAVAFNATPLITEVVDGEDWGCTDSNAGSNAAPGACGVQEWREMVADVAARGLLAELGLPRDAVLNVTDTPLSSASLNLRTRTLAATTALGTAQGAAGESTSVAEGSRPHNAPTASSPMPTLQSGLVTKCTQQEQQKQGAQHVAPKKKIGLMRPLGRVIKL